MLTSPLTTKLCVIVYTSRSRQHARAIGLSAYVISIFVPWRHCLTSSSSIFSYWISLCHTYFLRDYIVISNSIKRQHRTHFTHSPAGQRQRHVYYLTSDSMDELNNLIRIEELCRNLREQQEQQRQQSITPTSKFRIHKYNQPFTMLSVNPRKYT